MFADIAHYQIPGGDTFAYVAGPRVEAEIAAANLVPLPEEPRELFLMVDWENRETRTYNSREELLTELRQWVADYGDEWDIERRMNQDFEIYRIVDDKKVSFNVKVTHTVTLN